MGNNTELVAVRLTMDQRTWLANACQSRNASISQVLRSLIEAERDKAAR